MATRKTGKTGKPGKAGKTSKKRKTGKKSLSGLNKKTPTRKSGTGKKDQATRIILTTIAAGVAGIAGYLGWRYYKKHFAKKDDQDIPILDTTITTPPPLPPIKETKTHTGGGSGTKSRDDSFPLKNGSKGEHVRNVQRALINKYGSKVLPRYGADGDFGSETAAALKKNGYGDTITESTYNLIVGTGSVSDASSLAEKFQQAAFSRNFSAVMQLLGNLKSKQDYQQVSTAFAKTRLRGVRQTLVNGLLSSFTNGEQKQKIGMEFVRMGLQYDGNKYSLSGFGGRTIITTTPATVWISASQSIQVPSSMILGNEVSNNLGFTLFENNRKYFVVKTDAVKYL